VGNRGGGANFTFSMVFLSGIDEWADFVPFCTADLAASTQSNIYFRQSDERNLYFQGQPLLQASPVINNIPGTPYAFISIPLGTGTYYEMRGDSGASSGGSIFGYGAGRFSSNNGNSGAHTLDPEMIKSFAHPIGINNIPITSADTTPPLMVVSQSSGCGKWFITVYDTTTEFFNTGIYSILFAENAPPDSSYNVVFHTFPSFQYGAQSVTFEVDVVNLASSAAAALHIRDGAGNELDTTLFSSGLIVSASPQFLDGGFVRQGDSINRMIVLTNSSNVPVSFFGLKLRNGKFWKIVNKPPINLPLTLPAGGIDTVFLAYFAPISTTYECDPDTLIVNTCRDFPIATMNACLVKPAIDASDFDFGCRNIDTLTLPGDTVLSPRSVNGAFAANIGSDTLVISSATLKGLNVSDPSSDFAIMSYFDNTKNTHTTLPDTLPPGDTMFVIVRGHPHHSGDTYAAIVYADNANHYQKDTSFLHICGLVPSIVAQNVDYGKLLYATTKDSFAVVKNIGTAQFSVESLSPLGPDSAYFSAYPYGKGYIDPTTGVYIQYPDTFFVIFPYGAAGDSARYPYRFIAKKLGLNVDSLLVKNTSGAEPDITLSAIVVQPHIWAWSGCLADTLAIGDTATAVVRMGNSGTDILTVDSITITGPNPTNWTLSGIQNMATGEAVNLPFTLQPGDRADVSLHYKATQNGRPDEFVSFSGHDALGRHANDSLFSFYNWGSFPYDTNVRIVDCSVSGVAEHNNQSVPSDIILSQNYPNPFNVATTFTFLAKESSTYYIEIYNNLGARIASLPAVEIQPGKYSAAWNASGWVSGVYYYRVSDGVSNDLSGRAKSFLLLR